MVVSRTFSFLLQDKNHISDGDECEWGPINVLQYGSATGAATGRIAKTSR